jgi:hypothetical protein
MGGELLKESSSDAIGENEALDGLVRGGRGNGSWAWAADTRLEQAAVQLLEQSGSRADERLQHGPS